MRCCVCSALSMKEYILEIEPRDVSHILRYHLFGIVFTIAEQTLPRSLPMVAYLNLEHIRWFLRLGKQKD
jgi:hypothetical protein